ncbi:hypothetical protein AU195_23025 [Mycobacterium sp. IS-1496]|uniref:DUF732 domain-containing protein n=1 Tax=Mycobacterium sp. IS-1496 TaxID=1772284 RepID=UPI0007417C1D|nr:DUF732 domain-containing protein [Mycobacterium sp. IS-1496]KUI38863.1 hypothetical protein AU195_23025 [Mycobacterium sp. IS-1496]
MSATARTRLTVAACAAAVAGALLTAPTAAADPVDPMDTAFLNALNRAGVRYDNPVDTVALGKRVCPMLVEPGKDFAKVVATVRNDGVPPDLAAFFAGIAIQMYCPSMVSSVGNGTFLNWLQTTRFPRAR